MNRSMTQEIVLKATPMLLQEQIVVYTVVNVGAETKGWWDSLKRFACTPTI